MQPTVAEPAPPARPAAAPTLLDALARAPAAAALVVAALERAEDRKALRLAHPQLRDAVGEATTKLEAGFEADAAAARPPTARRWPRLEELTMRRREAAALDGLDRLRALWGDQSGDAQYALDEPSARALAAALRQMPALRALGLWDVALSDASAAEFFGAEGAAPALRRVAIVNAELTPAAARALAATGWQLEALDVSYNNRLGAAGAAALVAAPTFALRRLSLEGCGLDAAALLAVANTPWPLKDLDLSFNDFSDAAAGRALAALSQHRGICHLHVGCCRLSAAAFKTLVEASWPALTSLSASRAAIEFDGPHALGAAAFAGFPELDELQLSWIELGETGAHLLASRRWPGLRMMSLKGAQLGDAGVAALARGAWSALFHLNLEENGLGAPLALEEAHRWAPRLEELLQ
jgi:hypothetical protein